MFALFGAKVAAVGSACVQHCRFQRRALAAIAAVGLLSACAPTTVPLMGKDPADPAAKVAAIGYRSTIAPYTSLRPATLGPWPEPNANVAPRSKQEH